MARSFDNSLFSQRIGLCPHSSLPNPSIASHLFWRPAINRNRRCGEEGTTAQAVAGVLVGTLEQIGVKQVFGLIGDSLNPFTGS